ncbi:LOW QUALITY PROTEIN: 5-hydroxytryptamine receptor 3A [Pholidichthys leucotaenia]
MLAAFICLLFLSDGVHSERNCSYQDVLNYLNLTKNNEVYLMTRPVRNYKHSTQVSLEVLLYAILDVVEKDQKFIPYVWTVIRWHNEYISWDPNQFCGIDNVSLPTEMLWKPDLTIEEMTEKDKAPPSPYLTINNKGYVEVQNDQVLVSTCRMHIFKFPFDIQRCNLSFKSAIHTARDIRLQASDNSSEATEWSREVMRTQYEWLFMNMIVTTNNASDSFGQDMVIYTITMKRRSILYVVNFLLPVLFFVCLDLASFLISDKGGEKLCFKVTVLLAVTVLQLILNEILPASSNRIPLIAVYCIGNFALMLLSLLETIFVMYLMEKDPQGTEIIGDQSLGEGCNKESKANHSDHKDVNNWTQGACIYGISPDETPTEVLPEAKEGNCTKLKEFHHALERLSDELRGMDKTLTRLLNSKREDEKVGYWTRVAKKVNRMFLIFYITVLLVHCCWDDHLRMKLRLGSVNHANDCSCDVHLGNRWLGYDDLRS